jgi:membrane-associated phospholipid phosphatase
MTMKIQALLLFVIFAATVHGSDTVAALNPAPQSIRPFAITGKNDIPLFCAGVAFAAAGFAIEHSSEKPLTQQEIGSLNRNSVNRFDRSATYCYSKTIDGISTILVDLAIAAPLGLLADSKIRDDIKTFSLMFAEVEAFSYVFPSLGKVLYKRPRPYNYNPAVPLDVKQSDDSRASFFSRHTTFVFGSACFISTMYDGYHPESGLRPYVWAGSLAAASVVGYMRYRAGYHFPTDILAGALAGMLVGCGVPWLHKTKGLARRLSLIPVTDGFLLSLELNRKYR